MLERNAIDAAHTAEATLLAKQALRAKPAEARLDSAHLRAEQLNRISMGLVAAVSSQAIAELVSGEASAAVGAGSSAFGVLSPDNSTFRLELHAGGTAEEVERWQRFPNHGALPFPYVARTQEPLFVASPAEYVRRFPSIADSYRSHGYQSSAILPFSNNGRVLGAISLDFLEPHEFAEEEREFLTRVASQTALALERARQYEAEHCAREHAERAADHLARLQTLTAALSGAATPQQVAQTVLEQGMQSLGAAGGTLSLLDPSGRTQRQTMLSGFGGTGEEVVHWSTFAFNAPNPMNEVVRSGTPIEVESREEFSRRWPQLAATATVLNAQAFIAAPLEVGERILGGIGYYLPRSGPLPAGDSEFVMSLASLAAQALERARLYEEEHAARTEAEQANRAKSDFLAVMSHELRTPLATINGYVDLILTGAHGPLPEAYTDYADGIRSAQKYLVGLIDNVLRFAKIEAQRVAYDIGVHSVAEMLRALVPLVEPQVNARRIAFVIEAGDPAHCVRADRDKVLQILLNLVANSLKYTDPGGMVAVTTTCTGTSVDIRVTDTGRGIPRDRLQSIFEPFGQLDNSLPRETEGVGLGLAISRELARGMGGELEAVSTPGLGSCFTLYLPAA